MNSIKTLRIQLKSANPAQNYNHFKFFGKHNPSSIVLQPTDVYEIVEIISSLNDHKSLGYLDIPIRIIQESKYLIAGYLADSFNECIKSGSYSNILKIARVISLHKGGSILDLGNYRPIYICPQLTKCLKLFCINVFPNSGINIIYLLIVNLASEKKKHSTNNAITYKPVCTGSTCCVLRRVL